MRSSGRTVCKFKVTGIHVLDLENESEGPGNAEKQENHLPNIVQVPPGSRHGHETSEGCPVELGTAGVCSGSFRF